MIYNETMNTLVENTCITQTLKRKTKLSLKKNVHEN